MNKIIDIITQNLPAIILLLPIYLLIKRLITSNDRILKILYLNKNKSNNVPNELKIHAHERMLLFVERIKPESLIPRLYNENTTVSDFHLYLLNEIRKEFEYNLTQQLYISDEAWNACIIAKETMTGVINTAANQLNNDHSVKDFSNYIFKLYISQDKYIKNAIKILKRDIA